MDNKPNKRATIKVTNNVALESYSFASKCLEYAEQAKEDNDTANMRMFARTSIIYSALSAEADLIKMIEFTLKKVLSDTELIDEVKAKRELMYEYLTNFQAHKESEYNQVRFEIINIQKKYDYLRSINKLGFRELPKEYKELTLLRNKLIHYMNTYQPIAYSEELIEKAAWALHFAGEFIHHIRGISNQDIATWTYKSKSSSEGYEYE